MAVRVLKYKKLAEFCEVLLMCLAEKQQYETEFQRMIQNHMSFPSIVIYVVFNEGWGQYEVIAPPFNQYTLERCPPNAVVCLLSSSRAPSTGLHIHRSIMWKPTKQPADSRL